MPKEKVDFRTNRDKFAQISGIPAMAITTKEHLELITVKLEFLTLDESTLLIQALDESVYLHTRYLNEDVTDASNSVAREYIALSKEMLKKLGAI